jgi:ParB family chromosome partitioning protein
VENLQRRDLHYFEEAAAIADYIRHTGVTQEEAAARLGRSPSALANKLRLLRLSPDCRRLLADSGLTERHARCLLRLEDASAQLSAARHMAEKQLNVAQAEQYVERKLAELQSTPPAGRRTFILKDVRLFLNSLDRGLRLIREAGVDAQSARQETEDDILLTIRIPKQRRRSS